MSSSAWFCPLCQSQGQEPVTFCRNDGTRVRPISERGADWIGKVVDSEYRIVRFVDAGGSAEVYEAERATTGKRVALKLLHAALASRPEVMADFLQEAQLVSLIAHPNIVSIQGFGTVAGPAGPSHYMVMELLDGHPLSVEIERGALTPLTALRYAMQACEGMEAAHTRDVIHCDIKPANIFLQRALEGGEPVVKILDLGIGQLLARGTDARPGQPGVVSGTPEYMSPEQVSGHPLGPASDIYSMGVSIYEMLLGQLPFSGESYTDVLNGHLHDRPPWPEERADERGLPPGTRDVLWRSLAKNPRDRQGSMLELQSDLAGLARHEKARASARGAAVRGASLPPSARQSVAAPVRRTRQPMTARSLAEVREEAFQAEEEPTSGRWRFAAPSTRVSRTGLARIVPLALAAGTDEDVVELARDVYWVGRRHGGQLESNAYLRVFRGAGTEVSVLMDPGPPRDLDVVTRKVATILGSVKKLDFIYLDHPGPEVAGSAAPLHQAAPGARIVCSEDALRLAPSYGLDPARLLAVESFPDGLWKLATGHELVVVPAPFCPSRGGMMLFDPASGVLFSGDLFGGARASELLATDKGWPAIELFHQIHMPGRRGLELAVGRVRRLEPAPTLLAPRHGALVTGAEVGRTLERVGRLEVGLDLVSEEPADGRFREAANDLIREFAETAGESRASALLAASPTDPSFRRVVVLDASCQVVEWKVPPRLALAALAAGALAALPAEQRGDLQRSIREIWKAHRIDGS